MILQSVNVLLEIRPNLILALTCYDCDNEIVPHNSLTSIVNIISVPHLMNKC